MKGQWVDLAILAVAVFEVSRGYVAGFLVTVLSVIGYIGGGLAGLEVALHFQKGWSSVPGKVSMFIGAIVIGTSLGQWLMRKVGRFFHNKILFGPFQLLDSILGSAFSLIRVAVFTYIAAAILLATPWGWAHENIPPSKIYQELHKKAPNVLTKITDQIKSFT